MHSTERTRLFVALGLAALAAAAPLAAQKNAQEAEKPEDPVLYSQYGNPGEKHRLLDPMAGRWEATMSLWLHGTPPPEVKVSASMDNHWVFGGRYIEGRMQYTDNVKQPDGTVAVTDMVYHFGHSNGERRFWSVLMGNFQLQPTFSEGAWNEQAKTMTFTGTEHDWVTGDSFQKIEIFNQSRPDELGYELHYRFADGSEIRAARADFRRKK